MKSMKSMKFKNVKIGDYTKDNHGSVYYVDAVQKNTELIFRAVLDGVSTVWEEDGAIVSIYSGYGISMVEIITKETNPEYYL